MAIRNLIVVVLGGTTLSLTNLMLGAKSAVKTKEELAILIPRNSFRPCDVVAVITWYFPCLSDRITTVAQVLTLESNSINN